MRFRASYDISRDGIYLLIDEPTFEGVRRVVAPLQMELKEAPRGTPYEPTMMLTHTEALSLMEALWEVGIRPTEARHPSDHINALKDHLADLRALVFKTARRS